MNKLIFVIFLLPALCLGQLQGSGAISIGNLRTERGTSGAYALSTARTDFGLPAGEVSLSDFYGLSYPPSSISVAPTSKVPLPAGETWSVTVTATGAWTLAENQTWLSTNVTSGTGNGSVNVTATANNTGSSRNYTIVFTLTGTGLTANHSIFQNPQ